MTHRAMLEHERDDVVLRERISRAGFRIRCTGVSGGITECRIPGLNYAGLSIRACGLIGTSVSTRKQSEKSGETKREPRLRPRERVCRAIANQGQAR